MWSTVKMAGQFAITCVYLGGERCYEGEKAQERKKERKKECACSYRKYPYSSPLHGRDWNILGDGAVGSFVRPK